jgi:hypothetical protein
MPAGDSNDIAATLSDRRAAYSSASHPPREIPTMFALSSSK